MVQIEWTEEAENDLDDIIAYISKSSLQYTKSFFKSIHESLENLKLFPRMGRRVPESKNSEDRELIIQKYRIIYRFIEEKEKILVMMIIHGSRLLKI
ncbi:MAG: type II toxin-antitoxin system RelE/ParE family toxin [Candidatus Lokiarchaeota archaeon]|nr:type II toxin-antitoxin system RelE/ParE family toxin [Candidatus Lokiarchaeota archaeon]